MRETDRRTSRPDGRGSAEVLALPPGRELPPGTGAWIVDGLVETMPGLRMRELFALRRDMLTKAEYVVVGVDRELDRAVSLLTSRWAELPSGRRCLHVMVQFVGDAYRHGSLFGESWSAHFARLLADGRPFPEIIALKTYNPVVHCAMAAFSGHPDITMYPDLGGRHASGAPRLAAEVADALAPGAPFDPAGGVLRGIGRPVDLYRERPMSYVAETNAYFAANAAPGDRVLCLLHVPTRAGADSILSALGVPLPSGRV
ncbi:hypothetical protein [Streptomyces sp. MUM 178J]|uniref:hypothetical protein n=1 Tax=Streptomyces sp. MUM 178J TaxID=2791991 RepID=UPI001F033C08|nr:hypothetical protein [Streptomyces sp. MUM 178J]WRQ81277.1 hypothetical protein I3F59_019065 [Streptomyces sp. MUM 178J]